MKIIQINKVKVNIFEEDELREKLGMIEKDINLVITYQRTFPELLQDDIEGFVINSRTLHSQLNIRQDFSDWIKKQLTNLESEKEKDYTLLKGNCTTMRPNASIDYILTLDLAKEICMVTGVAPRTNKETKQLSKIVRTYFIIMEKTLRNYENWILTREPEKDGANIMRSHIASWCDRNNYDKTLKKFYTREFNLLNESLVGLDAQGIKCEIGYKDKQTREHLLELENRALSFLQDLNISLLDVDMSFEERTEIIKRTCDNKYANLKRI